MGGGYTLSKCALQLGVGNEQLRNQVSGFSCDHAMQSTFPLQIKGGDEANCAC